MGEIADGLINGDFDALTGEYLGEGNGFPRTTDWEHAKSTSTHYVGKRKHEKHNNYNGIVRYINTNYADKLPNIPEHKVGTWKRWYHNIIREYLIEKKYPTAGTINSQQYSVMLKKLKGIGINLKLF